MGDPKKKRKQYDTPKKMWDRASVEERRRLVEFYGLKNKKEIWKAGTTLRKKRQTARKLLALPLDKRKQREKELLDSLEALGIVKKNAKLNDVLSLSIESILDRRLQTLLWRNGLCATPTQARQLIIHGHIKIRGQKHSSPSYIVRKGEETSIDFIDPALKLKVKKAMKPEKKEKPKKEPESAVEKVKVAKPEEKKGEGKETGKKAAEKAKPGKKEPEKSGEKEDSEKEKTKKAGEKKPPKEKAGEKEEKKGEGK